MELQKNKIPFHGYFCDDEELDYYIEMLDGVRHLLKAIREQGVDEEDDFIEEIGVVATLLDLFLKLK